MIANVVAVVVLAVIMAVIVDDVYGDDTDIGNCNDCGGDIGNILSGRTPSSASQMTGFQS